MSAPDWTPGGKGDPFIGFLPSSVATRIDPVFIDELNEPAPYSDEFLLDMPPEVIAQLSAPLQRRYQQLVDRRAAEGRRRFEEVLATPTGAAIRVYPPLEEFTPPREFRMRPRRLKPGSLDELGNLVDADGDRCSTMAYMAGVIISYERAERIAVAGWHPSGSNGWLERSVIGK